VDGWCTEAGIRFRYVLYCSVVTVYPGLGPNFLNFLGRSLEDFFSKESMQMFETFSENVFERIWEDLPKKILRKGAQLLKLFETS